jgi:hypothetical protein
LEEKLATSFYKIEITAVGDPDYATPLYPQKLALTSSTSAGRSRTQAKDVILFSMFESEEIERMSD